MIFPLPTKSGARETDICVCFGTAASPYSGKPLNQEAGLRICSAFAGASCHDFLPLYEANTQKVSTALCTDALRASHLGFHCSRQSSRQADQEETVGLFQGYYF